MGRRKNRIDLILNSVISRIDESGYRLPEYLFLFIIFVSGLLIMIVNIEYSLNAFQNIMVSIGLAQALITGYLSYKIFSIGRRDSALPNLEISLCDSTFDELPITERTECEVDIILRNTSYGRAKIRDIDVTLEYSEGELNFNKHPREEGPIVYKDSGGPPIILDIDQEIVLNIYLPNFGAFDQAILYIDEADLGKQQYRISKFNIGTIAMTKQTDILDGHIDELPIKRF